MAKPKSSKTPSAIVPFTPALVESLKPAVNMVLEKIAEQLSLENLPPETLAATMKMLRDTSKVIEKGLEPVAKQRLITMIKEHGEKTTDKGSMSYTVSGWRLPMKPYRTGYDPKKLESLIRAKDRDPKTFMHTKLTYEVSEDGVKALQDKKVMTPDELESCRYAESWTVETPEPV